MFLFFDIFKNEISIFFQFQYCYAAQVLRSKYDKINVENSELLMQNINMHIQITIHTHYDKSSSSSRSDSSDSPGFLEI